VSEETKPTKSNKNLKLVLILLLIIVLLAAGVFVWLYIQNNNKQKYERYMFDTEAMEGRINRMTEQEVQDELDRIVEEGMFNISIASAVVFDSNCENGEARIENIAQNLYHMQVDIYITNDENDPNDDVCVYSSKLIQPGYSINYIKLNKKLEPGEYPALAVFSAITKEELQLMGTVAAQITLYIPNEQGRIPAPTPTPTPEPTAQVNN